MHRLKDYYSTRFFENKNIQSGYSNIKTILNSWIKMQNQTTSIASKDITVLCVEDSKVVRNQFGELLKMIFKDVILASNGSEGLDKFIKNDSIAIVITDLIMPNLNGIEMMKKIKLVKPTTQLIVVSAHQDSQNLFDCIKIGITDFVPKPLKFEELKIAVEKCITNLNLFYSQKNNQVDFDKMSLMDKLHNFKTNATQIELINHYKGVPIINLGYIINVEKTTITIQLPIIHSVTAELEKVVVFRNEFLEDDIEGYVIETIDNSTLKLGNLKPIKQSSRLRNNVRIIPDTEFKLNLLSKDKKYEARIIDISSKAISFSIPQFFDTQLVNVEVAMRFYLSRSNHIIVDRMMERINCKGDIIKFEIEGTTAKGLVFLDLSKKQENTLSRYIYQRALDLIKELKKLKKY
jgi:DNA-binding NarL/FixJ family response regulator